MDRVNPGFRVRLSRLRLAGKEIRSRFSSSPPPPLQGAAEVLRRSIHPTRQLESIYWRFARPGCYRLYWSDAGTFDLDSRRGFVHCFLPAHPSLTAVEEVLRGPVCSFFLLEHGFEPLHAGAVVLGGRCVALVGVAGAGKSSLVAYLSRHGAKFLSDDVLPLRCQARLVRAYSGLPQMRLTPQALSAVGKGLPLMWKTRWKATLQVRRAPRHVSYPMARIYLLDRREAMRPKRVELIPFSPRDAFLALVAHTTNDALATTSRMQQQLRIYGQLAARVPSRRLIYPSDFQELESVRRSILEDLKS